MTALGAVAAALAALDEPVRPRFGFGGRAFLDDPSLVAGIAGTYLGDDATAAAAGVERLLHGDAPGASAGA